MSGNRGGSTQGRRKIPMTRIANKRSRLVTFSKRREGLFRKASEISTLCGAEVAMIVFSPGDKVYSFGHPSVRSTINKYMGRDNHMDNVLPVMDVQERLRIHQLNQQLAERRSQLEAERSVGEELDETRKVAAQTPELWEVPERSLNREQRDQLQMMLEELQKDVDQQKTKVQEACEARKNVIARTASSSDGGANGGGFGNYIIPQGLSSGSGIGLRNFGASFSTDGVGNALHSTGKSVNVASASGIQCSMSPHGFSLGEGIDVGHHNTSSSFVAPSVAPIWSYGVRHVGPISSYDVGHFGPSSLGVGHPVALGKLSPSSFGVGYPSPSTSFGVAHTGPSWSHNVRNLGRSASAHCPNGGAQFPAPVGYSRGSSSGTYHGATTLSNVWTAGQPSSFGLENSYSAVNYTSNYGTSMLPQENTQGNAGPSALTATNASHSMTPHGYAQGIYGVGVGGGVAVGASSTYSLFGKVGQDSFSFAEDEFGGFNDLGVNDVGAAATDSTGFVCSVSPHESDVGGDGTGVGAVGLSSLLDVGQVGLPSSSGWPSGNGQGFPFDYYR